MSVQAEKNAMTLASAMDEASEAALAWLEKARTRDFSNFTEDEAKSFIGSIIDAYTFEILKSWDPQLMKTIGTPRG